MQIAPVKFRRDLWRQKTRVPGPSCGVCVILRLAVLVEHRLVTDRHRQTEKQTYRFLCSWLARAAMQKPTFGI